MDEIVLVPYDADWPQRFRDERLALERALPAAEIVHIEHAGSTAIPGLDAKPIVDIFIAVRDIGVARQAFVEPLRALAYVYWAENPDPERLFFVKGMPPFGPARTHHVHVMQPSARAWQRTLMFRDYLRAHQGEAQKYLDLKRDLAGRHPRDREAYTRAKDDYITDVVARAQRSQGKTTGGHP